MRVPYLALHNTYADETTQAIVARLGVVALRNSYARRYLSENRRFGQRRPGGPSRRIDALA